MQPRPFSFLLEIKMERLLKWDPEFQELRKFSENEPDELEGRGVPWCWLVFRPGCGWEIYLDGHGGGDLYYASLME